MKPKCPYLRNGQQTHPTGGAGAGQASSQIKTAPPQSSETAAVPPAPHSEVNEMEKRVKQQMENMERRMMDAMRKMLTPTSNAQNSNSNNQTEAVRTPDVVQEPEETQEDSNGSAPELGFQLQGSDAANSPVYGRQDHLKIL